jgi:hypothetical protein
MTKTITTSLISIFSLILFACSNQEARLKSIEEELSIELPKSFEVIQDDDISHNGFESDYTQIVTIKFEKDEFDQLINQIKNSPYFDQLAHYKGKSLQFPNSKISIQHSDILDSLSSISRSGTWVMENSNYKYIDFFTWADFCDGYIDTANRTLKYTHNHL